MRFDKGVELALDRTPNLVRHPVVKQHPVEVVVLVLKHPGLEAVEGHLELLAPQVLRLHLHAGGSLREHATKKRGGRHRVSARGERIGQKSLERGGVGRRVRV